MTRLKRFAKLWHRTSSSLLSWKQATGLITRPWARGDVAAARCAAELAAAGAVAFSPEEIDDSLPPATHHRAKIAGIGARAPVPAVAARALPLRQVALPVGSKITVSIGCGKAHAIGPTKVVSSNILRNSRASTHRLQSSGRRRIWPTCRRPATVVPFWRRAGKLANGLKSA